MLQFDALKMIFYITKHHAQIACMAGNTCVRSFLMQNLNIKTSSFYTIHYLLFCCVIEEYNFAMSCFVCLNRLHLHLFCLQGIRAPLTMEIIGAMLIRINNNSFSHTTRINCRRTHHSCSPDNMSSIEPL